MRDAAPVSIILSERDAAAVAAMAAALALPPDEFLGRVVATWLEKPKHYRRLAKRLLGEVDGRAREERRRRAREVARAHKRARRDAARGAKPRAAEGPAAQRARPAAASA